MTLSATAPTRGQWLQRLGLLVLAVFVVVMHHVVGAHAHGEDMAGMADHASAGMTDPSVRPEPPRVAGGQDLVFSSSSTPDRIVLTSLATDEGVPAPPVSRSSDLPPRAMLMLHPCMAVLAAVVALGALLLVATALAAPVTPATAPMRWLAHSPRPPPSQRRQARLQVLRL